eukprot:gnl/Chilomastix_cuspidata/3723.p1 GENE.gnl/Chilomastix_cuspidata/3723~~gnl/Chilomastix_cuspidata/3723.p1  ORF type:complete len:518 (+),score=109.00 gnl/Chilomastix_cuspidata/3723:131-1684(+)
MFHLQSKNCPTCHVHQKALIAFCRTCRKDLCASCIPECSEHLVVSLTDLISFIFPTPPLEIDIAEIKYAASLELLKLSEERKVKEGEIIATQKRIDLSKIAPSMIQKKIEKEVALLRSGLSALQTIADESESRALHAAAAGALRSMAVEEQIRAEFQAIKSTREHLEAKIVRLNQELLESHLRTRRFQQLRAILPSTFDSVDMCTLAFAFKDLSARADNGSVDSFAAFPGVERLSFVSKVFRRTQFNVLGVGISDPLIVPFLPGGTRNRRYASISREGVLVSSCRDVLFLDDLVTGRHVEIKSSISSYVFGFVQLGVLYVAWNKCSVMRRTPLVKAFLSPVFADFEKMKLPRPVSCSHCVDPPGTGTGSVFFCEYENPGVLLHFDAAQGSFQTRKVGRSVSHIGGFTGIRLPGNALIATDGEQETRAYALDRTDKLTGDFGPVCTFPQVFPSRQEPTNLQHAAIIDFQANLHFHGVSRKIDDILLPGLASFVRIFRNTFLAYDEISRSWVALQISVP